MGYRNLFFILSIAVFSLLTIGCGPGFQGQSTTNSMTTYSPEPSYCSNVVSYSSPVTVSANAQFYYRPTVLGTGLSGSPVAANIAYAEVAVYDSSGTIIQCSTTTSTGTISLQIPSKSGSYTLKVFSRAANSKLNASVLEDIYNNIPYSISKTFTLDGVQTTANVGTLYAYARRSQSSKMEGGAFNILNDLYLTNEFIRTQTANPSFVAPKVIGYWKAGFNPRSYVGDPDVLGSFYITGTRKLYILGGYNGSVQTDTDHFDNSVVIHEYGHFLEDVYSVPESPGNFHNGNAIIDPRLAWSEGWGNFIQAAVRSDSYYLDTAGFTDSGDSESGTTTMLIQINLNQNANLASYDRIATACSNCNGEGTFREISISRTLYKIISSSYVNAPFSVIWKAFSDSTDGLANAGLRFRNSAIFNSFVNTDLSSNYPTKVTSWNSLLSEERQSTNTHYYADSLNASVSACGSTTSINPVIDSTITVSVSPLVQFSLSDQLRSNRFYKFVQDGTYSSITLEYTQAVAPTNGNLINLDLVLFNSAYTYVEDQNLSGGNSSIVTQSRRPASIDYDSSSGKYKETINVSSLPAGTYMINVKTVTSGAVTADLNGTLNYNLTAIKSGASRYLCPAN